MKNILISSYDMDIGGVERSLINMLEKFDYEKYNIDLMLHIHRGELLKNIPKEVNILDEIYKYTTLRKSIKDNFKEGNLSIVISRVLAKYIATKASKKYTFKDSSYYQLQLMYKYSNYFLPKLDQEYDVAISYLWPHYFVADKVKAKTKIAWIHTDYSTIEININMDLKMWNKFDHIVSISNDCTQAFLNKYPELESKILVVENITSPEFVRQMAEEEINDISMNSKDFKIVSVGRYSDAKGFDNAIKAIKLLKDKDVNNVKWYVIGYGPDEEKLRNLIKEYDVVDMFFLLGKKTNPYSYIKKCDLYIQPSRYEGKAVTVLEAQMLGKPVLITNYLTAKSQLKHNIDGYITDLSVDGIARGIEKLMNDVNLRRKLEKNTKEFDYYNVEELEKLYEIIER